MVLHDFRAVAGDQKCLGMFKSSVLYEFNYVFDQMLAVPIVHINAFRGAFSS